MFVAISGDDVMAMPKFIGSGDDGTCAPIGMTRVIRMDGITAICEPMTW